VKIPKELIVKSVNILKKGGVVIFPTDTVYGFLADASNKKAVEKIFKIKNRPKKKPLSLFVKDIKMAKELALVDNFSIKFLKKYWPGKYTFVLKSKKAKIYGVKKDSIALRIPNYKPLNDILNNIKRPLVQTSVNISGKEPLNNIEEILKEFGGDKRVSLIVSAGNLKKSKSSKVIDLLDNKSKILRK